MHFKRKMSPENQDLTHADYEKLANFRYALRCFLDFSANAASSEGLTPQQHQALLAIRANPQPPASVGYLAERLQIRPNTAAELAMRLESAGLITRSGSQADRRSTDLILTAEGQNKLKSLTLAHRHELSQLRPAMLELLENLNAEAK